MRCLRVVFVTVFLIVVLVWAPLEARAAPHPPPSFVVQALCVHSGWHWKVAATRAERRRGEYWLWGDVYVRTWDVPDWWRGGSGEAAWNEVNAYGGGMQFLVGTWNRAADLSRGLVPRVGSQSEIARQRARVQIVAAWLIVRSGGSWREWPNTARACGLLG